MSVIRYRKKPVVVETQVWNGPEDIDEMWKFTGSKRFRVVVPARGDITGEVYDVLHSTWIGVKTGDLVIKGLAGEFYPHDAETMLKAYDNA
jgi:hypothetical protein